MARHGSTPMVRITTAPPTHGEDVSRRQRRYLISMGVRTLCFIGAVAVGPGILRWVLVVGAVFLPYVAVVMANRITPRLPGAPFESPGPRPDPELHGSDGPETGSTTGGDIS